MRRLLHTALALAFALLATAGPAAAQQTGAVRGRVVLGLEGIALAELGPVVVYLEPSAGDTAPPAAPAPRVLQKNATFAPGFLAIAVGQTVEMRNDDAIYHNVFSFSKPNGFDLGIYPAGESRSVTFRHPGVVRTYCSIHDSMRGTIFVSPSRHFAKVDGAGRFTLRDVPAGRHRLRAWCERLPEVVTTVEVLPGRTTTVQLSLGKTSP